MANLFSDSITERDTKGNISDFATMIGDASIASGSYQFLVSPTLGDVVLMLELPSQSKISSLKLANGDIGDGSAIDIGIYAGSKFTDTDGSETVYAKDDVILVDAFDNGDAGLNSAQLILPGEYRWQPTGTGSALANHNDELWQLAGLDSNPNVNLRVGIHIATAFTANFDSDKAHMNLVAFLTHK